MALSSLVAGSLRNVQSWLTNVYMSKTVGNLQGSKTGDLTRIWGSGVYPMFT